MALDIADNDLALWTDYLNKAGSRHTIIEGHLTRFMLVHICGHYEVEIFRIITDRVKRSGDSGVSSYVAYLLDHRVPIHPNSLKGALRGFGAECLDRFLQGVEHDDLRQYRAIVENRNKSAHGRPIQVTFDDVCTRHANAKRVIDTFGHALGL